MNRIISYGIDEDTGMVVSRVDREAAVPVLDFEAIGQGGDGYAPGDFRGPTRYHLEKAPIAEVYRHVRWTKKIAAEIKNQHREFWGFPPLKG